MLDSLYGFLSVIKCSLMSHLEHLPNTHLDWYLCLFFFFFLVCLHCLIKSLTSLFSNCEPLYFSILWACQLLKLHCPFPFLFSGLKQIYFNFFFWPCWILYPLPCFQNFGFCIASNLTFIFLSFPLSVISPDPRSKYSWY